MIFEQLEVGNMQNFCYLIGDEATRECALVDAGWDHEKILKIAGEERLRIKHILITHSHYDHTNSLGSLFEMTKAEIVVHEKDADDIENLGLPCRKVKEGDVIALGSMNVKVIHTPGHTPGSVCYLFGNKLLTGDTLFVGAVGRVDLPGSDPGQMYGSLQKLKRLDEAIEVCPGHDYGPKKTSTIGYEKEHNPYMKVSKEDFLEMR